jgi:hypothetical protein
MIPNPLHPTLWERAETRALLAAWTEARTMGLTVEQCDRIALAALNSLRDTLERRTQER